LPSVPDLPSEVVFDGLRAFSAASDLLDAAVADHLGLNRTDLRCLDHLARTGPPPAGHLATAVGLTTGALTTAVDRLERAGYVQRQHDAADRRRVLVALTPAAERVIALFTEVIGPMQRLVQLYSEQDLQVLATFLHEATEVFTARAAAIRTRT
jgi:DNA-binding MarR family transcriptional regulator